jgi:outer membrane protein TolC
MMTASIRIAALCTAVVAATAAPALAQSDRLTLADARARARGQSESLDIARAGEVRADADLQRATSLKLPQLSFASSYSRTLASEFSGAFEPSGPVCAPLAVDPSAPVADRLAELERAASCGAIGGGGFNFSNLPFGQRNVYQIGFSFAQAVYSGGRIRATARQAELGRQNAALVTSAADAQLVLAVTTAFYDAALSDRLVTIAESGLNQADASYAQVRLAFDAGRQPEFEVLRAQVARDNQRPTVIRSRATRDIAYLRLRQLLDLAPDAPLTLDVDLDAPALPPPAPFADALAAALAVGPAADRAAVRQAELAVGVREAGVTIAHAARRPSLDVTSAFSRVGYPSEGVFPGVGDFRTNWSLSASLQVPVFTGGRLKADEITAGANLTEAKAQLQQARELAVLDSATALQDLAAAEATLAASAGTIEQAQRAYEIADLRYREGLSTQLELSDSRLARQVAEANRAQAARDVQVARARVALLPNLPVAGR